jgi:hypothetical protein
MAIRGLAGHQPAARTQTKNDATQQIDRHGRSRRDCNPHGELKIRRIAFRPLRMIDDSLQTAYRLSGGK